MVKLQEIKRKNGTNVFPVILPKEKIEEAGFLKGDDLSVNCPKKGKIELTKEEKG